MTLIELIFSFLESTVKILYSDFNQGHFHVYVANFFSKTFISVIVSTYDHVFSYSRAVKLNIRFIPSLVIDNVDVFSLITLNSITYILSFLLDFNVFFVVDFFNKAKLEISRKIDIC